MNLPLIDYIHSTNIELYYIPGTALIHGKVQQFKYIYIYIYTHTHTHTHIYIYIYIVGGNVNWYSHYGEQYGGSLKN